MLVAPVVMLLLAVTAYPLVYNIWNSFHSDNLSIAERGQNASSASRTTRRCSSSVGVGQRALADAGVHGGLDRVRDDRWRSGWR